jgi:hypothetical protein
MAEADATGQLLAATVAILGAGLTRGLDAGRVPVGGIAVVTHDKDAVNVTAHRKALRAHELTVVNHKFLLRHGHLFTTLGAFEFHFCFLLVVTAKVLHY